MFKSLSTMTLLGIASVSAAFGQSSQPLQAEIPFAFTVQDSILPAGSYQFTYNNTSHRLSIRGLNQNSGSVLVTAAPTSASNHSNERARVTFHCYGRTCYLAEAWQDSSSGDRGLEVFETEHERRFAVAARVIAVTIPAR